ncbi:Phospholipase A2 2 precursor [Actinidia chinensis var. chinensis]|uniref:Phospholipase A2 2 n=1 Tax=Actinidia chinensis var. chinensis TaxID=1590841 RepID=A0A2R6PFG8_ACTCC|nr:Phospholipase A2 2 precursor [Actinidia chinensis var. chinensis]
MNFEFLSNIPWFGSTHANKDTRTAFMSTTATLETPKQRVSLDIKLWGWSLLSFVPWVINAGENIQVPSVVNKKLKRCAQRSSVADSGVGNSSIRFRPYVSKVPWHTGARGFLSQLFPRYGHYCGPNWSSGKDGGSLLWDKRPIDWLDFCCYCHDIGYDTHDQAELLKADLAFLECLERPHMSTKGDAHVAHLYKTMCTSGLRNILIPYRKNLLNLQSGQLTVGFGWLSNMKWK